MTPVELRAWLDNLKVGDEVAVRVEYPNPTRPTYYVETVECVTVKHVVVGGREYFRTTGALDMGKWSVGTRIVPPPGEARDVGAVLR